MAQPASPSTPVAADSQHALLPLGAMMLAASFGAWAQTAPAPANSGTLPTVVVRERAEAPEGKEAVRATNTTIGKGNQQLRDIPQSITVVTEKLIDDRNLDTVKDVLRNTGGISFLAAEGGEEDIRLRGFSLAGTGDLFLDGMRDPAFYDRDTFNHDRVEVLRGSASMLFGRGSTGGAVNQVSKVPRLVNEHEVVTTIGNHGYRRLTGDFNFHTSENAGLRVNVMGTKADNNGAGSSIEKNGIAAAYRWGIGTRNEFLASLYYLNNQNGINYGLPWIRPAGATSAANTIISGLDPKAYYGLASDYNDGSAAVATFAHLHRLDGGAEIRTQVRKGKFDRDLHPSTVRFAPAASQPGGQAASIENFGPGTVFTRGSPSKVQDVEVTQLQSDYSGKFDAFGVKHELLAGVDIAHEKKDLYALSAITKPGGTFGAPNSGASVNEASRTERHASGFDSRGWGAYVQDVVQIAPAWKVVGGLRYDRMRGNYDQFNTTGPAVTSYQQRISEWSKRVGLLYQPDARHSYHVSYGTSFNTSGDTYSYNALSANTPPESSVNFEIGGRIDTEDRRFTTRFAIFHSIKKNERNTDPDTASSRLLLSGQRHSSGLEIDLTGRLTPKWEVYGSYMWIPSAKVDKSAACPAGTTGCIQGTVGNREGDRPGLTPRHSGTIWTTYQATPKWRVGGGLNFRSSQAPADVTAPAWEAPGFVTADLMAEYNINQMLTLKANLSNVTNKLYGESLYRGHYIPGAGRLLQVALTARF